MLKSTINVRNLSKSFDISTKEPGLSGTIKHFFRRQTKSLKVIKDISFEIKEGEIIINTENISDPNFSRIVARYVSKWTGRIWTISNSNSNIGKTLQEEDIINQQKEINIMKKDPTVQEILNKFPGISIHSISPINETIDDKDEIMTESKHSKGE